MFLNGLNGQSFFNSSSIKSLFKNARNQRYEYYDDMMTARSDMYWLVPIAFVIGSGVLFLPIIAILCSMLFTTGTINLTAGRKKRSVQDFLKNFSTKPSSQLIDELVKQLSVAWDKFEKF